MAVSDGGNVTQVPPSFRSWGAEPAISIKQDTVTMMRDPQRMSREGVRSQLVADSDQNAQAGVSGFLSHHMKGQWTGAPRVRDIQAVGLGVGNGSAS